MYSRSCICRNNLKVELIPRVNLWNCALFRKANICKDSLVALTGCCSSLLVRQLLNIVLAWIFPPSVRLSVAFELVLDALYMECKGWGVGGRSETEGTKMICAYHAYLSSYWQKSAWSSVGDCTCIQRGGESGRNGGGTVGVGEKKSLPARHLIGGRFRWWSQKDLIVPKTALSVLFVSARACVMFYAGKKGRFYSFLCPGLNWMSSVADRPLTAEPI